MAKLAIDTRSCGRSMDTVKVSGFTDGELSELKSMEHMEAMAAVLDLLDNRNNGIGTIWHNGVGVYSLWFDNEAAYLNIGKSCD